MKLWTQPFGPLQTNGFMLANEKGEGVIIDPGMEAEDLLALAATMKIQAILLTHAHFDHIGSLEQIREETGAPVYLHDLEAEWLTDPEKNGSARWPMVTQPMICRERDASLSHGDRLHLADMAIEVLHTPGHSPGSVSFYLPEEKILIAGDTLFAGSIGRTDLPGGHYQTLMESIQHHFLSLPEDVLVYPGHGPETCIGEEKKYNPFISGIGR